MDKALTNSQMRAADEYTIKTLGVPSKILMHRAGAALADEVLKAVMERGAKKVVVVCGTGNNGGDGYVCARILSERDVCVKVYALDGRLSEDCAREKSAYTGGYAQDVDGDVIVDCIFGTGLSREVSGEAAKIIGKINSSSAYVISADIPSGLNGDSGKISGCAVRADKTVAIAEYKTGHFLGDGIDLCGTLVKKDIGITCPEKAYAQIYGDKDIKAFFPERRRNTHKGSYGSANIIAGSSKYTGAAALACEAALKSGCGYVKLTTEREVQRTLAPEFPQVIYLDEADLTADSIAVGMGCGVSELLYAKLKKILAEYGGTVILDADGINTISEFGIDILINKRCRVVLTPHPKEFSRLTKLTVEQISSEPLNVAKDFAKKYGVILLLKGAASIITDGEKTVINTRGSTALAKGGSGDMFSGFMSGSVARGLDPFDGAVCASYTLGIAAEEVTRQKTDYCATAKDIINNLHSAVLRLTR